MNKFRILYITGLLIIGVPFIGILMLVLSYTNTEAAPQRIIEKIITRTKSDTVVVRKIVMDTIKIKVYEKVPQIDTKRVDVQPTPIKDSI